MSSFSKPTNEQISAAVPMLSSPQHERYFFERLKNPLWIDPLKQRGLFSHPPPAETVPGGGVRFPPWAASRYLARMAKELPNEVAATFADIDTDNASVLNDLIDAALMMPADSAATLVPVVSTAAEAGTLWIGFKDASALCAKLAAEGQPDSAITLAKALYAPAFEQGADEPKRREVYWYKEGLKKLLPVLVAMRAEEFCHALCVWLRKAVEARKYVDPESGADFSYSWRPAIEEHEQNRDYDFTGEMVGFARQGLEQAVAANLLSLDAALSLVDEHPYLVFKRLRVHLINTFADRNPDLAREMMMDRSLFDDYEFKHEYAMLVGRHLPMLSSGERETWFRWIENGPDMSEFDERIEGNLGRDATDDDREERKNYWKYEKLHWVREHLEGSWRTFYEHMLAIHGEPDMADLNVRVGRTRVGHESPIEVDELKRLTFGEAVERIAAWKPETPRFMGPDVEGLASSFGEYVSGDPEEFSKHSAEMIDRPAIFVRGFISRISAAVQAGLAIDVAAVLRLCKWVVEQPIKPAADTADKTGWFVDKDWQWTRDEISRLVENVCKAKSGNAPEYPFDALRRPLWGLIEVLYRDHAGSNIVQDISEEDPRIHDYLHLGINSPRGKAVEAALEYARWIADHVKQLDGKQEIVPGGFDAMPEVREMLEWQISPENRSVQALSVIGSRMGTIYWIDSAWLAKNARQIFQLEGVEATPPAAHGWAAWNAFLVWVRPHIEFYRLFKPEFAFAVEQASKVKLTDREREQPMHRLGEHLIILHGRGELSLDADEQLLRRFLSEAIPDIRRHAMGFVGRSVEGDERMPAEVLQRFMDLWDWYWPAYGRNDAIENRGNWLFGVWFTSEQFPQQWSIERLEQFVQVVPSPEPDDLIVARLAEIAQTDISRVTSILDSMIRGDKEGWHVHGWLDAAKQILRLALSADATVKEKTVQLIDYLGRRGYTDFGELLQR